MHPFTKYTVAAFVLCIYDVLLALSRELEYVWASPMTLTKAMYFVNRYGMLSITFYYVLSE